MRVRQNKTHPNALKKSPKGGGLVPAIEMVRLAALRPSPRNARKHPARQMRDLRRSIAQFGFNSPVLVDNHNEIVAGHARAEAARQLGFSEVPVLRLSHLSAVEQRAYRVVDNRVAEPARWDRELLAVELEEISQLLPSDLDLTITGFELVEVGQIMAVLDGRGGEHGDRGDGDGEVGRAGERRNRRARETSNSKAEATVSRPGDVWLLGRHRLSCGASRASKVGAARDVDALRHVDGAIRHWQEFARAEAVLKRTGKTFEDVGAQRARTIRAPSRNAVRTPRGSQTSGGQSR